MPSFTKPLALSALLLGTFISISGCSPSEGDKLKGDAAELAHCELPGQAFGIVGGDTLASGNELSASTVFILHIDSQENETICTGTLIDTDKVLTAAHCVSQFGGKITVIGFTNNVDCATKAMNRTLRVVKSHVSHPDYSYWREDIVKNSSSDLAVLKFEGTLPPGYKIRELPSEDFTPTPGAELVMAGYGVTKENNKDAGVLRFTSATQENLTKDAYIKATKSRISPPKTWILQQPQQGVCTGDSGGPLYLNSGNDLTLVGITSAGIDHNTEAKEEARLCHGISIFTDIRPHLEWILKQKNSL